MKSKTAIAALAATLAMCFPARAVPLITVVPVTPDTIITANFTATIPFDGYLIQVGYGAPNYGVGTYRASLYDSSHSLVDSVMINAFNHTYDNAWDIRTSTGLSSSFSVVLDDFTGSNWNIQQVTFAPWLNSINYWSNAGSLTDGGLSTNPPLQVTVSSVPGPIVGAGLPGLIAACGGLLALARRRRQLVV